jgi:hypothetical protein
MTGRIDRITVTAWHTGRNTHTAGRKIGSSGEHAGAVRFRCGAVTGESAHGPMT